jgi:hypothetical protein
VATLSVSPRTVNARRPASAIALANGRRARTAAPVSTAAASAIIAARITYGGSAVKQPTTPGAAGAGSPRPTNSH